MGKEFSILSNFGPTCVKSILTKPVAYCHARSPRFPRLFRLNTTEWRELAGLEEASRHPAMGKTPGTNRVVHGENFTPPSTFERLAADSDKGNIKRPMRDRHGRVPG